MSRLLKGNYPLPSGPEKPKTEGSEETSTQVFERRALEHLGGSIAFVMKRDTFVWKGDAKDTAKHASKDATASS